MLRRHLHEAGGHRGTRSQHGSALSSGCVPERQEAARWWTRRRTSAPLAAAPAQGTPGGPEGGACGGLGDSNGSEGSAGGGAGQGAGAERGPTGRRSLPCICRLVGLSRASPRGAFSSAQSRTCVRNLGNESAPEEPTADGSETHHDRERRRRGSTQEPERREGARKPPGPAASTDGVPATGTARLGGWTPGRPAASA